MKKTILFLFILGTFFSCNSERLAALEAENLELKTSVELLTQQVKEAQQVASIQRARAETAQRQADLARSEALIARDLAVEEAKKANNK